MSIGLQSNYLAEGLYYGSIHTFKRYPLYRWHRFHYTLAVQEHQYEALLSSSFHIIKGQSQMDGSYIYNELC
jgi:hypothetical protein